MTADEYQKWSAEVSHVNEFTRRFMTNIYRRYSSGGGDFDFAMSPSATWLCIVCRKFDQSILSGLESGLLPCNFVYGRPCSARFRSWSAIYKGTWKQLRIRFSHSIRNEIYFFIYIFSQEISLNNIVLWLKTDLSFFSIYFSRI